jgi:hypothetical protein
MESWQEEANVSHIFNEGLDSWLLCPKILLQGEDLVHTAPFLCDWCALFKKLRIFCRHRILSLFCKCSMMLCIFAELRLPARCTLTHYISTVPPTLLCKFIPD